MGPTHQTHRTVPSISLRQFFEAIALPLFKGLASVLPDIGPLYEQVHANYQASVNVLPCTKVLPGVNMTNHHTRNMHAHECCIGTLVPRAHFIPPGSRPPPHPNLSIFTPSAPFVGTDVDHHRGE